MGSFEAESWVCGSVFKKPEGVMGSPAALFILKRFGKRGCGMLKFFWPEPFKDAYDFMKLF